MSNPGSNDTSRSNSPAGLAPGAERSRAVSGSLKDRIAKFNNPDAAPLAPKHPFGTAGPAGSGASGQQRGLYGNRIPSLDPRFSGHLSGLGAPPGRKVSENRGMIGNRIPSTSTGNVNALTGDKTGSSGRASPAPQTPPVSTPSADGGAVPGPKATERPASPEGSVNSSTASNALGTNSPATSRSSSPPTSPGGTHTSLVHATLPEGGPGAMTPSSTRAEAGDTAELSAPSTPVVGAQAESLPAPEYDLVPHNLKLAAGLHSGLLSSASAARSFAPSIGSSLASQYDPSNQGEKQMMQDVSGISTPTGTPRAANRELEGSTRGEGSAAGSVVGDGDLEEVKNRLDSLAIEQDEGSEEAEKIDRDPTPEPLPVQADLTGELEADSTATEQDFSEVPESGSLPENASMPSNEAEKAVGGTENVRARDEAVAAGGTDHETHAKNPNKAEDLEALKAGELSEEHDHDPSYGDRPLPGKATNPINPLAEMGFMQNLVEREVKPDERKEQGGMAGQRMEDIEKPDEIVEPASTAGASSVGGVKVEDASSHGSEIERAAAVDHEQAELNTTSKDASAQKDGPSKSEKDAAAGKEGPDAGAGDNVNMTDTFGMREPAAMPSNKQEAREAGGEGEESGSEGETEKPPKVHGTLGGVQHTDHVGPDEPSVLERIGVGQSEEADGRRRQIEEGFAENGLLDYPSQEDQLREHKDKDQRDGKTLVGELQKMASEEQEAKEAEHVLEAPQAEEKDPDERGDGNSIPNPFKAAGGTHRPATASIAPRASSPGHGILEAEQKDDDPLDLNGAKEIGPNGEVESNEEKKPLQIQIEPAPIAQTADAKSEKETQRSTGETVETEDPKRGGTTPTPLLPSPPAVEPDEVDPPRSARSVGTGASTPIDPHFLKSFPAVPDEERPRIEVHLSPHATPFVPRYPFPRQDSADSSGPTVTVQPDDSASQTGEDDGSGEGKGMSELGPAAAKQAEDRHEAGETAGTGLGDKADLADVPSVPMPTLDDAKTAAAKGKIPNLAPSPPSPSKVHEPALEPGVEHSHVDAGVDAEGNTKAVKLTELDAMDPRDPRKESIKESRSYSNSSLDVSDQESASGAAQGQGEHGGVAKVKRRMSRKPPKSPMLDDEDPGDWVPGEDDWARVTKTRDS